ncbi:tripartite tricarboxylate transporter substrate binding protein [Bordetella sp. 15P40C-2]|uniref:Bug family tripartite tricarboxylate transporter substrate binding protein n=1 Tax=Bordetella sp. 15P40C-2 TaxID=2572246 RepID=UPI001365BA31|nr:tripartite tricarboxylate transporter substrate binding protein [Bordetella sp. 15P40C-2]
MKRALLLALASFMFVGAPTQAANYPDKPVRMIVGYPPGGASDMVARLLAAELEKVNGTPFVVENRPGVGGMLSLSTLSRSPTDGYTLGLGVSGTLVTGPHLQKNQLYDPKSDFAPVAMVAKVPMVLLGGPALKQNSVEELIAEAKANPQGIIFASGAQAFELALQLLNHKAGVQITSASYKGGAAASIDVMAGRVPIMIDSVGAQLNNIKQGNLRALAVLDDARSPVLPDVATMQEAGVPGYDAVGWIALLAPKGTPGAVVDKLSKQVNDIVQMPEFKTKLMALGFQPESSTPEGLQKTIEADYAKWGEVVRTAGMKAE